MTAPGALKHAAAGNGALSEVIGLNLLPTPRASDGKGAGGPHGSGGPDLKYAITLLPTPQAHDAHGAKTAAQVETARQHGAGFRNLCETVVNEQLGPYAPACNRWALVTGNPVPAPVEPSASGKPRLAAKFAEWMMGIPPGWITDVPGISRAAALKMCGNGVVPQQATLALTKLLPQIGTEP
jgi:DNA (cytosine-5)-methyltransferase 1